MNWSEIAYPEAKAWIEQGTVAFLPCGATEAHGPHLPLETDVIIAREAADRAARLLMRERVSAVVLPPLAYAVTEFASGFPGTLSISKEAETALVRDVLVSAHRSGLKGVVLVNAHLEPGHIQALSEAKAAAEAQGACVAFPDITRKPHALRLSDEFKSGACHAGEYETSLVLAARPELVQEQLAKTLPDNPASLSVAIREGKSTFEEAGGDQAYFGYPAQATEEEGERLYGILAEIFAEAARELLRPGA